MNRLEVQIADLIETTQSMVRNRGKIVIKQGEPLSRAVDTPLHSYMNSMSGDAGEKVTSDFSEFQLKQELGISSKMLSGMNTYIGKGVDKSHRTARIRYLR